MAIRTRLISVNWRALIAVVALGVMIAWAIRSLQGSPEADFTADEEAMLERLEPILDTLVLQQEDLSLLAGHFQPCEGGELYQLQYGSDADSPDVEHIHVDREAYEAPIAYSSFCDAGSGAYVSSVVSLPYDKEHLSFLIAAYEELARGGEGPLQELAAISSDDADSGEEVLDYRWVSAPTIGDWRYAFARTVDDSGGDQLFEWYSVKLLRGGVMGGVAVGVPGHATAESEVLAIAQAFDNRIAAKLESLAAEVQAP